MRIGGTDAFPRRNKFRAPTITIKNSKPGIAVGVIIGVRGEYWQTCGEGKGTGDAAKGASGI